MITLNLPSQKKLSHKYAVGIIHTARVNYHVIKIRVDKSVPVLFYQY